MVDVYPLMLTFHCLSPPPHTHTHFPPYSPSFRAGVFFNDHLLVQTESSSEIFHIDDSEVDGFACYLFSHRHNCFVPGVCESVVIGVPNTCPGREVALLGMLGPTRTMISGDLGPSVIFGGAMLNSESDR